MNGTMPMLLTIKPLTPWFGAEITGVDLTKPVDDAVFREIETAFNTYSVLVFRDQDFDDESQIAFSERFGPLESTIKSNVGGAGTNVAVISNVGEDGQIMPPSDMVMRYHSGNEMWHTDSSFKAVPALASLLSGREVPPSGGETEFASMRAAYDRLPEERKAWLDDKIAVHDFSYSRGLIAPDLLTKEGREEVPPVRHPVIRQNSSNGLKNFYAGAHASFIEGLPVGEGREILRDLTRMATEADYVYQHQWRPKDAVMWDNRCCLHRGRPWAKARYRRVMHRTTLAGDGPTVEQPYAKNLPPEAIASAA